jgi:hypothetical protein
VTSDLVLTVSAPIMLKSMLAEPTVCPFCWKDPLGRVRSIEELSLFAGRFEICSVTAYRCAQGHVFLIPRGASPLEAPASEILV